MPNGISSVAAALLGVMFGLSLGAEIVTTAAAEAQNPAEQIGSRHRFRDRRICLFYIGSIFLIVCLVPWNDPLLGQAGYGAYRRTLELLGLPDIAPLAHELCGVDLGQQLLISAHYTSSRMLYSHAGRCACPAATHPRQRHSVARSHRLLSDGSSRRRAEFLRLTAPQRYFGCAHECTTGMIAMLVYLVVAFRN